MVENHEACALAIVGSRDAPGYQVSALVKQAILEHRPRVVISGGAIGVDTIAVIVARELKIPTIEIIPSAKTWDAPEAVGSPVEEFGDNGMRIVVPGGYKQRNEKIAEMCECLVRIASPTTKTYGSGWTADHAEILGRRVFRYTT